jgi:diguanylate cyclase (GGDEF)-like protein
LHHGPREVRELADAFNRMTERLEHLALHDQLTGLPNRRYLDAFLGDLRRTRVPYAVMVLDVDGFKPINDHHGHAVGDSILSALAERMRKTVSADGFCARVGGDEFVIVVTGHAHAVLPLRVIVLGERIRESAAVPVSLDGKTLSVTSSIGIALGDNPAGDPTEMFRNADRALYAAKASGRNRLVVFDGTQPDVVVEHHDRGNARSAA